MSEGKSAAVDHYETLQISPNADADTIQRVFRLLAQRYHPDNKDTGNALKFRALHEAYSVLSVPDKRAQYDVHHQALRRERWRFVASAAAGDTDVDQEQQLRSTLLEILYARRRAEPGNPAFSQYDLSQLTGRPREHLEFTIWYLIQRKLVTRDDSSSLAITADGVDYLEQNQGARIKRRLTSSAGGSSES